MKRFHLIVGFLIVAALILAACTPVTPPAPSPSPSPTTAPSPTAKPSPTVTPAPPMTGIPANFLVAKGNGPGTALPNILADFATSHTSMKGSVTNMGTTAVHLDRIEKYAGQTVRGSCMPCHRVAMWSTAQGTYDATFYSLTSTNGILDGDRSQLRALFGGTGPLITVVYAVQTTPNSGIKTMTDLKGKKVAQVGNLIHSEPTMVGILKAYGMTLADLQWSTMSSDAAYKALQAGTIDALFYNAASGSEDMAKATGLFIIPLSAAAQKAAEDTGFGFTAGTWAKGFFGNSVDTPAIASPPVAWSSTRFSDDAAYALVKAVFSNLPDFYKSPDPVAKGITKESIFNQWLFPYHNGAIRYYKETGLWTADMDKKQADALARWASVKPNPAAPRAEPPPASPAASPSPTATPASATPTPSPTTPATSAKFEFTSVPESVKAGLLITVVGKAAPNTECKLTLTYSNGQISSLIFGVGLAKADAAGKVQWVGTIDPVKVIAGKTKLEVSLDGGKTVEATTYFEIIKGG